MYRVGAIGSEVIEQQPFPAADVVVSNHSGTLMPIIPTSISSPNNQGAALKALLPETASRTRPDSTAGSWPYQSVACRSWCSSQLLSIFIRLTIVAISRKNATCYSKVKFKFNELQFTVYLTFYSRYKMGFVQD